MLPANAIGPDAVCEPTNPDIEIVEEAAKSQFVWSDIIIVFDAEIRGQLCAEVLTKNPGTIISNGFEPLTTPIAD